MDKLTAKSKRGDSSDKSDKKEGFFRSCAAAVRGGIKRAGRKDAALFDLCVLMLSFILSRGHLVFGARPLGLALVSVLPSGVWLAALGAVLGSLSLGKSGIIYAMISVIVVFLRVIVSGTEKGDGRADAPILFTESLILRMSASLIGGFIAGLYEVLLSGFTLSTVLFGVSMVFIPPITVFALSGLFESGYSPRELIFGTGALLTRAAKSEKAKMTRIFFECSALTLVFLIGLCLKEYALLGISASYVFSAVITIFAAKRFGAVRAAVLAFFSSLGVSSTAAVAFSLGGIGAGVLFGLGAAPALVGAGLAAAAWGYYAEGLVGIVSLLPEYCIGGAITLPILNKLAPERAPKEAEKEEKTAADMVGTVTMSYKNKYKGALDELESSLYSVSAAIDEYKKGSLVIKREDLERILVATLGEFFANDYGTDYIDPPEISKEVLADLTTILCKNGRISPSDVVSMPLYPYTPESYAEAVNRAISLLEKDRHKDTAQAMHEHIPLIAKLINESRICDGEEKATDDALSLSLTKMLAERGLESVCARVIGRRKKHVVVACHDPDGSRVTDPDLLTGIEGLIGSELSLPDYYRKGDVALFEATATPSYAAECAIATAAGDKSSVSGDTAEGFESSDGYFFSVISDGMGSGEEASRTSRFATEFMKRSLSFGTGRESIVRLFNDTVRRSKDECSVTLDLFSFDLYTSEATFIKSGAAPSYIKRGASIFRIRSKTAPLGLFPTVDAEKIKVSVERGDYIIMLSDGICAGSEGWLAELLAKPAPASIKDFADKILAEARRRCPHTDDMTVLVAHLTRRKGTK